MSKLEDKMEMFFKEKRKSGRIFFLKKLGLNIVRGATDEETAERSEFDRRKYPILGIEFQCLSCEKISFSDLIDPWSYNSHAFCQHCNIRKNFTPRGINFGVSFAYWQICFSVAKQKYPKSPKRQKVTAFKFAFLGLDTDYIPADREGKTYEDLELNSTLHRIIHMTTMMRMR